MRQHDDPPIATFRLLYSAATWTGLALLTLALLWLLWTLFALTSAGTARTQALAVMRPTVTAIAAEYASAEGGAPVAVALPATCAACHAIAGTSAQGKICPDLTNIGAVAAARIGQANYTGAAQSSEDYIRESILEPSIYVVPGETYGKPGASTMPAAVGSALSPKELNDLVTYLASLQ
jgi:nitric oxide reductase subunit C